MVVVFDVNPATHFNGYLCFVQNEHHREHRDRRNQAEHNSRLSASGDRAFCEWLAAKQ
jgi:hypothetical protein